MERILIAVVISIMAMVVPTAAAEPKGASKTVPAYNPAVVYPGDYKDDIIMFRNTPASAWQRIPRLDRFRHISCLSALESLKKDGRWQGHLNLDGSCGVAGEPADWITGNRLNYEDSLE